MAKASCQLPSVGDTTVKSSMESLSASEAKSEVGSEASWDKLDMLFDNALPLFEMARFFKSFRVFLRKLVIPSSRSVDPDRTLEVTLPVVLLALVAKDEINFEFDILLVWEMMELDLEDEVFCDIIGMTGKEGS